MRNGPYIMVIAPEDYPGKKYRDRYCYEHHLVWWQNTDEVIGKGMVVHHLNHDRHDNRFENLEVMGAGEHSGFHNSERRKPDVTYQCKYCGEDKTIRGKEFDFRTKTRKNGLFCDQRCGALFQHHGPKKGYASA